LKTLALDVDPEVYAALENYRKYINENTGGDLTGEEMAVALLKLSLRERGSLQEV